MVSSEMQTPTFDFEQTVADIKAFQPALQQINEEATVIFDSLYDELCKEGETVEDSPIKRFFTANICPVERVPMIRKVIVSLGEKRTLIIWKATNSAPNEYPRQRVMYVRPEGENSRHIDLIYTHNPRRREYPWDISGTDYDSKGMCVGLIGRMYERADELIEEISRAMDEANKVTIYYKEANGIS